MTNVGYMGPQPHTPDRALDLWHMTSGELGADIETNSLDDRRPIGISLSPRPDEAYYFPINSPYLPWHVLANPGITKVFHNGHFDIGVLDEFCGRKVRNVVDTVIGAQLMGLPAQLAALSLYLFNAKWDSIPDLVGTGKSAILMSQVPEAKVAEKCNNDARHTLWAWLTIKTAVPQKAFALEMKLMPVLMAIEQRGMLVDIPRIMEHRSRVKKEVDYYRAIAIGHGFNPGSSMQVAAVLESRGWPIKYDRTTGKPVMNKFMLKNFYAEDPLATLTLLYRKNKILLSTFIDSLLNNHLVNGRTHGRINQNIARSGRLTRTKPNLQNIPEVMRDIYISSPGCYLESRDMSQIELRCLAYLVWQFTGDYSMQKLFDDGVDIHDGVQQVVGLATRVMAKGLNFGVTYGGDERTLNRTLGIPIPAAREIIAAYFAAFPGVKMYVDMVHTFLANNGYVETILGRQRHFEAIKSGRQLEAWEFNAIMREGFNTVIQGSAAEYLKEWQVREAGSPQINTVHDEMVLDVPNGTELETTSHYGLAQHETPITIKRGQNWKDLVKV
jgi:DNA polymerase-1